MRTPLNSCLFSTSDNTITTKRMKKILTALTSVLCAVVAMTLVTGCASTTTTAAAGAPKKEIMLQQAGFKTHTVATAKQQQHMQTLPAGKVSLVKHNGKIFYAYPDTAHKQVYTGSKAQYQAYKQALVQAAKQNQGINVDPDPHGVVVNEFDGWGPGPLAPTDGY
jgi:hypothetical protein